MKEDGYNVYAVGRRNCDNGFFETKGITFIGGVDVSDKSTFDKLPKEKIDVVVNMAGTMPAHANRDMMPYVQSIIVGTVNISEWMKNVKCQRILFNTTPSDTTEYWGITTPIDDDVVRSFPKNVLGWEPVWTWKKACMDMRKEYIENPMELLWGKNDELDQIK